MSLMSRAIGLLVPLTLFHSWRWTDLLMKQIIINSSAMLYLELDPGTTKDPPPGSVADQLIRKEITL